MYHTYMDMHTNNKVFTNGQASLTLSTIGNLMHDCQYICHCSYDLSMFCSLLSRSTRPNNHNSILFITILLNFALQNTLFL